MKKVDILIPVYNCEKYIERCIRSLEQQTYKDIRIVVVNDGSTDGTTEILERLSQEFENVNVYVREGGKKGISVVRNYLLTKLKSPYFTFVDADDYAEETYIEELVKLLETYNADMSLCGKFKHKENQEPDTEKLNKDYKLVFMNNHEALAEMFSSNLYNGTVYCKLFKRELATDCQFNEDIGYGEDLGFCYQVMKKCNKFVLTTKMLYHYIVRKGSIVNSSFNEKKLTCIDAYQNIIDDLTDEELICCAKSMQGLIAIELLYYTWRDHYKNKQVKRNLKKMIADNMVFIKKNKRLSKLLQKTPYVWKLTKLM